MIAGIVHLWVLEDNDEDFELIEAACARSNHLISIQRFVSGEKLLQYVGNCSPTLIYLDLRLPIAGGMEVLQTFKQNLLFENVPKLVFSTSANPLEIRQAYQLGISSFHVKRVQTSEMIELLDKTLDYWLNIVALPPETRPLLPRESSR
ncbi:response regulator [Stieleria sp. JC731]|uniref:response regulator n=1 Tax=Pirellulaceae TaxID=2691357 RepID=UPI001E63F53F|nr:response regulator [Stieleria sp. JC731]MCC9599202.1 response regulator [Stieleria sp. JC731]